MSPSHTNGATLEVNGASLFMHESGKGQRAVCMLHGVLFSHSIFESQIRALSDTYRCIAWDHRGQGQSSPASGLTVSLDLLADDTIAAVEKLGVAPVHLMGHSMGAQVAMIAAAKRPDLFRSLVIIESTPIEEPFLGMPMQLILSAIASVFGVNRFIAKNALPIVVGNKTLQQKDKHEPYIQMITKNKRSVVKSVLGQAFRRDLTKDLPKITCPTLVVWSQEERSMPRPYAYKCAELIPNSRFVEIPDAGHLPMLENPEALNKELKSFLASVDAA